MTRYEEMVFERKAEQHFRGQRELPEGRNFLWNTFRFREEYDMDAYRKNFDKIFPNAPGANL